MNEQQTTEWGFEARWVNLGEREPNHDDEVFARKTAEDFLTVIYFAEEGDIKYSINGESYIFEDQMDQWEWLELRQKEKPEPAVPLPDGIHEVTLPDGRAALVSDSGGYYGPAVPLPDGCKIEVSHCIQRIELPDGRAFFGFEENNSEPVVPVTDERPEWVIVARKWYDDMYNRNNFDSLKIPEMFELYEKLNEKGEDDEMNNSEPVVPLPDGSNMKIGDHLIVEDEKTGEERRFIIGEQTTVKGETLPDGTELRVVTTKTIRDKMIPWESAPAIPLPGGGNIRVLRDVEFANLAEMFRLQHHLNSRIGADMVDVDAVGDKESIARWTQKFVTAMQQELAELVDCVPWKWWRPDEAQPYDRQNARVEIVDLFHFLISLAQLHGMSAEDVYNTYKAKCQINHERQDSGYLQKDPDDCRGI